MCKAEVTRGPSFTSGRRVRQILPKRGVMLGLSALLVCLEAFVSFWDASRVRWLPGLLREPYDEEQ